jgi:hypothetical protein
MRARGLLRLYPSAWRLRYGEELEELLGEQRLTLPLAVDLLRGSLDAHLHRELAGPAVVGVGRSRMNFSTLRQPTAMLPLVMSLAALSLVLCHIAMFGVSRQPDEGTAAHLWQVLIAGQLPIVAFFAITSLPRRPRQALVVLVLQAVAVLAAAAPVFILRW